MLSHAHSHPSPPATPTPDDPDREAVRQTGLEIGPTGALNEDDNPFDTPMASRTSLNIPDHSAIMTESEHAPEDEPPTPTQGKLQPPGTSPKRPTIQASSASFTGEPTQPQKQQQKQRKQQQAKKAHPPPQPLGLPAPRAPPRPDGAPPIDEEPEPVLSPSVSSSPSPSPEEVARRREEELAELNKPPARWWHEWLCGCGEGPDRGGDHQVRVAIPLSAAWDLLRLHRRLGERIRWSSCYPYAAVLSLLSLIPLPFLAIGRCVSSILINDAYEDILYDARYGGVSSSE